MNSRMLLLLHVGRRNLVYSHIYISHVPTHAHMHTHTHTHTSCTHAPHMCTHAPCAPCPYTPHMCTHAHIHLTCAHMHTSPHMYTHAHIYTPRTHAHITSQMHIYTSLIQAAMESGFEDRIPCHTVTMACISSNAAIATGEYCYYRRC